MPVSPGTQSRLPEFPEMSARLPVRISLRGISSDPAVRIEIDGNDITSACQSVTVKSRAGWITGVELEILTTDLELELEGEVDVLTKLADTFDLADMRISGDMGPIQKPDLEP
jgi:hypothetical protein